MTPELPQATGAKISRQKTARAISKIISGARHQSDNTRLAPWRMFVYRLAVYLGAFILEVLLAHSQQKIVGLERLETLLKEQGAVVPVFWHQHLLMGALCSSSKNRRLKPGFMISPSVDGQAPDHVAVFYGASCRPGSGSYTGVRAVRGVYNAIMKDGISPTITPRWSRGPQFKLKPGAIFTAQISGKAVVPITCAASPAKLLRTWDKFVDSRAVAAPAHRSGRAVLTRRNE